MVGKHCQETLFPFLCLSWKADWLNLMADRRWSLSLMCVQAWLFQSPKGISRRASILDIFGHVEWQLVTGILNFVRYPFPSNFPAPVWSQGQNCFHRGFRRLCWDSDSSAASFRIAFQAAPKKLASRLYVKTEKVCCSCFELCFVISVISCFFFSFFLLFQGPRWSWKWWHGRNTNLNRSHRYSGLMRDTYLLFNISHFSMRGVKRITGTCNFSAAADIRCGFELFPSVLFISCPGKESSNAKSHVRPAVYWFAGHKMFVWSFWKILWNTCWMSLDHLVHFLALLIISTRESFWSKFGPIGTNPSSKIKNWKPQIE